MFGLNWDSREEIVEDGRFFEAIRYVELYFPMSQQSLWVSGLVRTAKNHSLVICDIFFKDRRRKFAAQNRWNSPSKNTFLVGADGLHT